MYETDKSETAQAPAREGYWVLAFSHVPYHPGEVGGLGLLHWCPGFMEENLQTLDPEQSN